LGKAAAQVGGVEGHIDRVESDPALNHGGNIRLERGAAHYRVDPLT